MHLVIVVYINIRLVYQVCQWVTSEIVQSQSLELRVRVIEKYIRIALVSCLLMLM